MKHVQRQQSPLNVPRHNLVANALQHLAEDAIGQPETLAVKFRFTQAAAAGSSPAFRWIVS